MYRQIFRSAKSRQYKKNSPIHNFVPQIDLFLTTNKFFNKKVVFPTFSYIKFTFSTNPKGVVIEILLELFEGKK